MILNDTTLIESLSKAAALAARIKSGEILRDEAAALGFGSCFNRMRSAARELGAASPVSREDITLLSDHSVSGRRPRDWWQED